MSTKRESKHKCLWDIVYVLIVSINAKLQVFLIGISVYIIYS